MIRREIINSQSSIIYNNDVPYISFRALERFDFIGHGFSTRYGGVSTGYFESMNLGFNRGDDERNVHENYNRIGRAIGFNTKRLVFTDQWHTTNIRTATEADAGKGIIRPRDYKNIDGHITNIEELVLLAFGADCVPVFFVDPENQAIGICHSGWKGTINNISERLIKAMKQEYNTNPEKLVTVIGPSICRECYEIGEEVAEPFLNRYRDIQNDISTRVVFDGRQKGKYYLDLWRANKYNLLWSGIKEENISVCEVCTMCNPKLLFSHRRDGVNRGSMAGFIFLTTQNSRKQNEE